MTITMVVGTGNPGKLREIQAYLADFPWNLELKPDELDIEETGETFLDNACLKASGVAQATGKWAIADDSGLAVDALDGRPGIYSARYGKDDQDRISRLLSEMKDITNRKAKFVCAIAIASPDGQIAHKAQGICIGEILHEIRGIGGFGYEPIFYVPEQKQTFAEMKPEIKRLFSHRGEAFKSIREQIVDGVLSA